MNIQPTYSSLDYPKKMALVVFTPGCDLRCKYCHNPQLLRETKLSSEDILEIDEEIQNNLDFIDAIVISGGEALLHLDFVKYIIKKAKSADLLVKLDTNGLHPNELSQIIKSLDYVAMDIKAPLDEYYKITDVYPKDVKERILKSIDITLENDVFLECRTTYVPNLLMPEDIKLLVSQIKCNQYTLQQFRNKITFDSRLSNYEEPNPDELIEILKSLDTSVPQINLKSKQFGNQIIKKE
ncbi:MAG: anaerobic ribonucleoside-triphosphate reductase activating protein [Methanosphaera stadtmanae]|nr:anaerobic ribonucleoside-triphosphate reductase activating protein [Methanosphaera stadtmanae]